MNYKELTWRKGGDQSLSLSHKVLHSPKTHNAFTLLLTPLALCWDTGRGSVSKNMSLSTCILGYWCCLCLTLFPLMNIQMMLEMGLTSMNSCYGNLQRSIPLIPNCPHFLNIIHILEVNEIPAHR